MASEPAGNDVKGSPASNEETPVFRGFLNHSRTCQMSSCTLYGPPPSNSRGNTQFPPSGNSYSDARGDGGDAFHHPDGADEDLAYILSVLDRRSPERRARILAIVQDGGQL